MKRFQPTAWHDAANQQKHAICSCTTVISGCLLLLLLLSQKNHTHHSQHQYPQMFNNYFQFVSNEAAQVFLFQDNVETILPDVVLLDRLTASLPLVQTEARLTKKKWRALHVSMASLWSESFFTLTQDAASPTVNISRLMRSWGELVKNTSLIDFVHALGAFSLRREFALQNRNTDNNSLRAVTWEMDYSFAFLMYHWAGEWMAEPLHTDEVAQLLADLSAEYVKLYTPPRSSKVTGSDSVQRFMQVNYQKLEFIHSVQHGIVWHRLRDPRLSPTMFWDLSRKLCDASAIPYCLQATGHAVFYRFASALSSPHLSARLQLALHAWKLSHVDGVKLISSILAFCSGAPITVMYYGCLHGARHSVLEYLTPWRAFPDWRSLMAVVPWTSDPGPQCEPSNGCGF